MEILHTDRRTGVFTVDEYVRFGDKVKAEIAEYQRRLVELDVRNAEYQSQAAELVKLLRDFPSIYAAQDYAGRAKLLRAIVQRVTLRAGEAEVTFQPPFDVLAEAGRVLYNESRWGEYRASLKTLLRHLDISPAIKVLRSFQAGACPGLWHESEGRCR